MLLPTGLTMFLPYDGVERPDSDLLSWTFEHVDGFTNKLAHSPRRLPLDSRSQPHIYIDAQDPSIRLTVSNV